MHQLSSLLLNTFSKTISLLKSRQAPGYDLISPKILKELTEVGISFILYIFNAILRNVSFPIQWKRAQIKMILKPGKPPDMASSYSLHQATSDSFKSIRHITLKKNPAYYR